MTIHICKIHLDIMHCLDLILLNRYITIYIKQLFSIHEQICILNFTYVFSVNDIILSSFCT